MVELLSPPKDTSAPGADVPQVKKCSWDLSHSVPKESNVLKGGKRTNKAPGDRCEVKGAAHGKDVLRREWGNAPRTECPQAGSPFVTRAS